MKTIDQIKQNRVVSEQAKEKRKEYARIKKLILQSLQDGPKTIPDIAEKLQLPLEIITYNLMTIRKYGEIETGDPDEMDEYYYYRLSEKK